MSRAGRWWPEVVLLALLSGFVVLGADSVPFHPDETSWLFQSRDTEILLTQPLALAWRSDSPASAEMTYRLLNAPLAKYVFGAARALIRAPASDVAVDWDWSRSWEENVAAGALPPSRVLAAARVASAVLVALAVVVLYLCGRFLAGRGAGLAAAALLATNALALLHGRRAMAEGALTFAICLALLGLLHADRHPWLAGVATALAFAAKTSAAVWLPLGLIAAAWSPEPERRTTRAILGRVGAFTAAAIGVTLLLYPVLWGQPVQALAAMWRARQELVASQVAVIGAAMPWAAPSGLGARAAALLVHLFFSPLQFAEAANYLAATAGNEASYLALPGQTLFRGLAGGAVLLSLTILGVILGARKVGGAPPAARRALVLTLLGSAAQALALVWAVPLAFQRYVMPLVPLVCLWCGLALSDLVELATRNRRPESGPAAIETR
ncbi:MAG TPA: glycosyltransferase family 39 protein [Anaerolineales bacterium]|nr:glycosyltransferase family 39 protein [Anaerolineales bacterium]